MTPLIITVVVLVLIALWAAGTYNALIATRNQVDEAGSDIHVQMRRRYDLIPNLVETVKGYAKHEDDLFTKVTEARAGAISANGGGINAEQQAEKTLSGALRTVFAVAENYPELKANENFMQLSKELSETEDKLEAARRFYNATVREYNTRIQVIPGNIIAGLARFTARELYVLESPEVAEPVTVKF